MTIVFAQMTCRHHASKHQIMELKTTRKSILKAFKSANLYYLVYNFRRARCLTFQVSPFLYFGISSNHTFRDKTSFRHTLHLLKIPYLMGPILTGGDTLEHKVDG